MRRPKGWRVIVVAGRQLWWTVGQPKVLVRTRVDTLTAPVEEIRCDVVVRRADGEGRKLVAWFRGQRAIAVPAGGFADVQSFSVTPQAVHRLVDLAAPAGVWPEGTGELHVDIALADHGLPDDLTFRAEHLAGLTRLR